MAEKALTAVVQEAYVQRSVDDLVQAMGMTGISKSQVSRLCAEIDDKVKAFLARPIEGDWLYLRIDASLAEPSGDLIASVLLPVTTSACSCDGSQSFCASSARFLENVPAQNIA